MYAEFLKNVRKCYLRRNEKTLIKKLYIFDMYSTDSEFFVQSTGQPFICTSKYADLLVFDENMSIFLYSFVSKK
jgi:hypothetical protein